MGSFVSKPPPPTVKPRDERRVLAASQHIDGVARDMLIELDKDISGKVLFAPKGNPLGGTKDSDAYHKQRERPFFFNDCNYPSAIVLVESTDDVAKTVQLATRLVQHLEDENQTHSMNDDGGANLVYALCIAAGCHSSLGMVEKSICIDMENLVDVHVNLEDKTVSVQGGAKIGMVHAALKGTGFGFMTGTNEDTGVSGLTLAGGVGWLGGQAGFACDTVVEAEVVLPCGKIVVARDDNDYKDLLRALRGGGGNFGIVTKWTFKLFDVTNSLGGQVVHFAPTKYNLKYVLRNYAKIMEEIPDAGGSVFVLLPGTPLCVNLLSMIGDEVNDAKTAVDVPFLKKISKLGAWFRVSVDLGRKDYMTEIAPMLESVQQRTFGSVIGAMVYSMDDALLDALVHFSRVDIPGTNTKPFIEIIGIFGEMHRNDGSMSSILHRKAIAWIVIGAMYEAHATEEEIQNVTNWADRTKAKILEIGGTDGPHNFRDTTGQRIGHFSDEQRCFLEKTRNKYDPKNLMTTNKNIVAENTE